MPIGIPQLASAPPDTETEPVPGGLVRPQGASSEQEPKLGKPREFLTHLIDTFGEDQAYRLISQLVAGERSPKREFRKDMLLGANTDANGNCVAELYTAPGGFETHVARLTVSLASISTYNPSAPYAAAGSYMFIAISSSGTTGNATGIASLWTGMRAFAPTSSAGPILPGQWTFNDTNAPIAKDGQGIYLVIVGAGAIASQQLVFNLRVNEREI